jgi:chemotaxis protein methyltransferase CheR
MDDVQFRRILDHLELSWSGYRKVRKGVKKRISRHMKTLNCSNMAGYLHEIDKSKETRDECDRLMTVSISRFFRDKKLWDLLLDEILPELIEQHPEKIRVWCAGCACGEEAYSLKILWDALESFDGHSPALDITATDMNPVTLERARNGIYPSSSLKEVSEEVCSQYFHSVEEGEKFRIIDSLKKGLDWRVHNLLSGMLESQFQIIFLRNNLLTYYQNEIRRAALKKVLTCLSVGGFLIIGSHERLPFKTSELHAYGSLPYIFKKQESSDPSTFVTSGEE